MNIYLLNVLLLIIENFILINHKQIDGKKIFCIIACFQWIIISGLRGISVGMDTANYKYSWEQVKVIPLNQFFYNLFNINLQITDERDPGYYLITKLLQFIINDFQLYLIFVAIFFTVPMSIWIYKNSKDPYISFIIYSGLFYALYAITGLRQTLATSIAIFFSFDYLKKRKFIPFLLLLLLATTIHKSLLIYMLLYFFIKYKLNNKIFYISIILLFLSFIFVHQLNYFFQIIGGYHEQYQTDYTGKGAFMFFIYFYFLFIFCLYTYNIFNLKNNINKINHISFFALIIGMFFSPLIILHPTSIRLVYTFSIYIILLIPNLIDYYPIKQKNIFNIIITLVVILHIIKLNNYYIFFWQ